MNQRFRPLSIFCSLFCMVWADAPLAAVEEAITFEQHVRPILKAYISSATE